MIGVTRRIHYFDRYLKKDIFPLFLNEVSREIEIRLITTRGNQNFGVHHLTPVSNLARQEVTNYQLIEVSQSDLHDRNLRVDDSFFSLGPGVDRAGMALTNFNPSDSTATGHQSLDSLISRGAVIHSS